MSEKPEQPFGPPNFDDTVRRIIDDAIRHQNEVVLPTQRFVYPPAQSLTQKSRDDIQFQVFEFDTITVEGSEVKRIPKQARYFLENLGETVTLEMIQIPSGSFLMGESEKEVDEDEEISQHLVNISSFCIGKFAVTQAQWEVIMHHNLSANKGMNLPVENVSWKDANEFCRRLSLLTGRCYRLPSEAEWEYACRANTTTIFCFGDELTTELANYWNWGTSAENSQDEVIIPTQPVGSYPANGFGLYDMHGNVFELCQDAWHNDYLGAPTDGSAWGSGEETGIVVIRGGSFNYYKDECRCANRSDTEINYRYPGTGFRVACSMDF